VWVTQPFARLRRGYEEHDEIAGYGYADSDEGEYRLSGPGGGRG
jgi:hypothetical protein